MSSRRFVPVGLATALLIASAVLASESAPPSETTDGSTEIRGSPSESPSTHPTIDCCMETTVSPIPLRVSMGTTHRLEVRHVIPAHEAPLYRLVFVSPPTYSYAYLALYPAPAESWVLIVRESAPVYGFSPYVFGHDCHHTATFITREVAVHNSSNNWTTATTTPFATHTTFSQPPTTASTTSQG